MAEVFDVSEDLRVISGFSRVKPPWMADVDAWTMEERAWNQHFYGARKR